MALLTREQFETKIQQFIPDAKLEAIRATLDYILEEFTMEGIYFARDRLTFTTLAPVDITDITVNQGETDVLCPQTAANWKDQFVRITGTIAWYLIEDPVPGVGFTLGSAFEGADVAGVTGRVCFPRVVLPAPLAWPDRIVQPNEEILHDGTNDVALEEIGQIEFEPYKYVNVLPRNDNFEHEILLVPFPNAIYTYTVWGFAMVQKFEGANSYCGVPEMFQSVLTAGVLSLMWDIEDTVDRSMLWERRYQQGIKQMKKVGRSKLGGTAKSAYREHGQYAIRIDSIP